MSQEGDKNYGYNDPSLQGQGQGQLEGQLQGELQGQGQGELQGQGQGQEQSSDNWNGNGNGNLNLNADGALAGAGALSGSSSEADSSSHTAANVCDNVNVDVQVAVSDCVTPPSETGVLNMDGLHVCNTDGIFITIPDLGTQTLNGDGSIFHLDQVNDLVNNGSVCGLSDGITIGDTTANGGFGSIASDGYNDAPGFAGTNPGNGGSSSFSFSQSANSNGGSATDTAYSAGVNAAVNGAASTAAGITQEAFTQHVILGSNIQYNSLPITVVGGDSVSGVNGDVHTHSQS